jgi:hypothetical protein
MRTAFSNIVSNTLSKLPDDELMMRNTSAVAVCWLRASASSLLSHAMSDLWSAADELTGRAVLLGRFSAAGLRRRDLADPALERRFMAPPLA